jgi:hypothetical protein
MQMKVGGGGGLHDHKNVAWDPAVKGRILRLVATTLSMWNEIDLF